VNSARFNRQPRLAAKRYATFMKKIVLTAFIVLSFAVKVNSQISGKALLYDKGCYAMISINNELPYVTTDNEGNFNLDFMKEKNKISILTSWIPIEIMNIPNLGKVNIGEFNIPMRKAISIEEYKNLSKTEKKNCKPVYHWTELLGYEYLNQLSEPCLQFKCGEMKYEICDFKFNIKKQKVLIDWQQIKICQN
jgi:hypothetical protein